MRVLLDENIDVKLKSEFHGHDVNHVEDLGWKQVQNGELLRRARIQFDVFVTTDKGILHQHSHTGHALIIVVLRLNNNRKGTQREAAPRISEALSKARPGDLVEIWP